MDERGLCVTAYAHVGAATRIGWRIHPAEDRVVLDLDGPEGGLVLFVVRRELECLRDALTVALAELDTARATGAERVADTCVAGAVGPDTGGTP